MAPYHAMLLKLTAVTALYLCLLWTCVYLAVRAGKGGKR